MESETLEIGEVLQRTAEIVKRSLGSVLLYVVGLSGTTIVVDLTNPESTGLNLLVSIAAFAAGYLLIRAMVREAGLTGDSNGGSFGAYFGLSLLSGLALVVGFACLVIPGLILLVRWQPAFAILMSEGHVSVGGSLSKAWHMTGDSFWPLLAATLIGALMWGLGILGYLAPDLGFGAPFEIPVVVGEILISCSTVYSTALGVAAYSLLRREEPGLAEIFA